MGYVPSDLASLSAAQHVLGWAGKRAGKRTFLVVDRKIQVNRHE